MVVAGILPLPWDLEERDVEVSMDYAPQLSLCGTRTGHQALHAI